MIQHYLSPSRCLTVLLLLVATSAWSQSQTVSGRVTSADDGTGIPGVNVVEKGTTNGVVTDVDGSYVISVGENATLVFSFVGFATQEIPTANRSRIDVALKGDITALTEVVVIGYGEQQKRDATGAVIALGEEEFNRGVISSPEQLLQGRAAGVQITPSSGEPGAPVNIRIRGTTSVRAGNNPLYVVDGVPLAAGDVTAGGSSATGLGTTTPRNPLNFLNPADIESISVLKDASAAAIYGARGANGVILITTKKGKSGTPSLDFSASASVSKPLKKLDVLDASEYVSAAQASGANPAAVNFGGSTDWQDEIFQTAYTQNYSLGYGAGGENGNYRVSFSYMDQEGILKNSGLERITGRVNASQRLLNDKVTLDIQLTGSRVNDTYAPLGDNVGFEGNIIGAALQANPTRNIRNNDGEFNQGSDWRNPAAMLAYIEDYSMTTRILSNVGVTWEIVDGLSYKLNLGIDNSESVRRTNVDRRLHFNDILDRGRGIIANRYLNSEVLEHTLNYSKQIGDNKLEALAGFSYQRFENRGHSITADRFTASTVPNVDNLDGANNTDFNAFSAASDRAIEELQSYFTRVRYSIADKYMLSAMVRADGSTKFGENNKYGYFPSFSAAWRLSEEDFVPDALYDLKLRAGWGQVGNQEFPGGASKSVTYYTSNGGQRTDNEFNPDLKWEATAQWGVGVDFALMGGRLSGSFDYFHKTTKDLLIRREYPAPSFVNTRWENLPGDVVNKGVELALDWWVVDNPSLTWQISANATIVKNVTRNFGTVAINTGTVSGQGLTGAYAQRIANGQPLYAFYMRTFAGFDEGGFGLYSNEERLSFVGDPFPDATWGLSNNFTFGRFDASLFINGAVGMDIYNNTANAIFLKGNLANGRNVTKEVAYGPESPANFGEVSTRFLEKGDYVRVSNLSIGYNFNLPDSEYIRSLRISLTGQNLLLFTDYTGYDPETNTNKSLNDVPSLGIDYTSTPSARTFTLGLNVGF